MASVIYSSKWYNIDDIQSRKMISLLLLRSQAHNRLSAYGLYDLSMETFSKVSQKCYRFMVLVFKIDENK